MDWATAQPQERSNLIPGLRSVNEHRLPLGPFCALGRASHTSRVGGSAWMGDPKAPMTTTPLMASRVVAVSSLGQPCTSGVPYEPQMYWRGDCRTQTTQFTKERLSLTEAIPLRMSVG